VTDSATALEAAALAVRPADEPSDDDAAPGVRQPGDRQRENDGGGGRRLAGRERVQAEEEQVQHDDRADDRPGRRPELVRALPRAIFRAATAAAAIGLPALGAPSLLRVLPVGQLHLVHDPAIVPLRAAVRKLDIR
jgi:hypothetical protein